MKYRVWIKDEAKNEVRSLPGHIRQRIRRKIIEIRSEPRPYHSKTLVTQYQTDLEVRRFRLGNWRVIYFIDEKWSEVGILAVRKRPPYNYEDLVELIDDLRD